MSERSDSSGTPWAGRELPPAPFAGDEGRPDPALAAALRGYREQPRGAGGTGGAGSTAEQAVHARLAQARIFVAVVAVPGTDDKDTSDAADMALITLTGPDGRRRLPAFTDPVALAAWRGDARPVPVPARAVALAAVSEGCELLALDPAGPVPYLVRRPALWALAQARPWQPSWADPAVAAAIGRSVRRADPSGDVQVRLEAGELAELRILLGLAPGRSPEQVERLTTTLSEELAGDPVVAERVDSVEVSVQRL